MAGKKLNTYVHVDGVQYGPDDDVPADVAKKIENPDVWGESDGATEPEVPSDQVVAKNFGSQGTG